MSLEWQIIAVFVVPYLVLFVLGGTISLFRTGWYRLYDGSDWPSIHPMRRLPR